MRRLTDSDWRVVTRLHALLNRCHLMGGSAAVESKANITSRLRQYTQTLEELVTAAASRSVLDLEVAAFASRTRDRMLSDKDSYLSHAVLDADALSPRTVPSDRVRERLLDMIGRMPGDQAVETPEVVTRELDSWLRARPACGEHACELEWYREHEAEFPVLARMARRIFAINSTSVECERMFSIAGNITTPRRTRMLDETVENLVEYRAWWEYTAYSRRLRRGRCAEGLAGASGAMRRESAPFTPRTHRSWEVHPPDLAGLVAATATVRPAQPPSPVRGPTATPSEAAGVPSHGAAGVPAETTVSAGPAQEEPQTQVPRQMTLHECDSWGAQLGNSAPQVQPVSTPAGDTVTRRRRRRRNANGGRLANPRRLVDCLPAPVTGDAARGDDGDGTVTAFPDDAPPSPNYPARRRPPQRTGWGARRSEGEGLTAGGEEHTGREGEGPTGTQAGRHAETETEIEGEGPTRAHAHRQAETAAERETGRDGEAPTGNQAERQTERDAERETRRLGQGLTGTHAERQIDREVESAAGTVDALNTVITRAGHGRITTRAEHRRSTGASSGPTATQQAKRPCWRVIGRQPWRS
eukprot:GHVU01116474.1.p1 GENE.GHVU01116474.1~~GHVU01116474.1.p1  ORF type:complete len:585 (+),score=48.88 GHVU01116474.1:447-2201(+)